MSDLLGYNLCNDDRTSGRTHLGDYMKDDHGGWAIYSDRCGLTETLFGGLVVTSGAVNDK